MNGESLRVQKLLLARGALKREMALMILKMIVHRILILLYCLANVADKLTVGIFLIRVRHGLYLIDGAQALQFFRRLRREPPPGAGD